LKELLKQSGFVRIEEFDSTDSDCSSLPVSLNMQAVKPVPISKQPVIRAVMSVPRLGFMDNAFSLVSLANAGIQIRKVTGAFWGQCMERAIEESLQEGCDYILTIDYDSVFRLEHLKELCFAARGYPEYDAIASLQVSRSLKSCMMVIGKPNQECNAKPFYQHDVVQANSAHFGLTLIKAEAFKDLKHPWFWGQPNEQGKWEDGRTDDDIFFWEIFKTSGKKLGIATRVAIGHMELMIKWPNQKLETTYQCIHDYYKSGEPEDIWI